MVRERRSFSSDFKKQIVESIVSGSATQAELAREHRISPVMINRWKKDYRNQTIYDIYNINGSTLLFGHGFRGDSDTMQVKDNNFGLNPETRFTTLNEFIVYKK